MDFNAFFVGRPLSPERTQTCLELLRVLATVRILDGESEAFKEAERDARTEQFVIVILLNYHVAPG